MSCSVVFKVVLVHVHWQNPAWYSERVWFLSTTFPQQDIHCTADPKSYQELYIHALMILSGWNAVFPCFHPFVYECWLFVHRLIIQCLPKNGSLSIRSPGKFLVTKEWLIMLWRQWLQSCYVGRSWKHVLSMDLLVTLLSHMHVHSWWYPRRGLRMNSLDWRLLFWSQDWEDIFFLSGYIFCYLAF